LCISRDMMCTGSALISLCRYGYNVVDLKIRFLELYLNMDKAVKHRRYRNLYPMGI